MFNFFDIKINYIITFVTTNFDYASNIAENFTFL